MCTPTTTVTCLQDGDDSAGEEEESTIFFAREAIGIFGEKDRTAGLKLAFDQPSVTPERGVCCSNTVESRLRHILQSSSSSNDERNSHNNNTPAARDPAVCTHALSALLQKSFRTRIPYSSNKRVPIDFDSECLYSLVLVCTILDFDHVEVCGLAVLMLVSTLVALDG